MEVDLERVSNDSQDSHSTHSSSESSEDVEAQKAQDEGVLQFTKRQRWLRTIALVFVLLAAGLCMGITSSTLLDLRDNLEGDRTMAELSLAVTFRSLGNILGALSGGILGDRFFRYGDLILAVAVLNMGTMAILKPFVSYLEVLGVVYFLDGTSHGCVNAVQARAIVQLWGGGAAPMIGVQAGKALGFALGPILAMPFIATRDDEGHSQSNTTTIWTDTTDDDLSDGNDSRIEIPYTIIGTFTILCGLFFIGLHIKGDLRRQSDLVQTGGNANKQDNDSNKMTLKKTLSPATCGEGDSVFSLEIITLSVIFMIFLMARDIVLDLYIYSVAVEGDLGFSSDEAALLDFSFKLCTFLGIFLVIPPSIFLPVEVLMFILTYSCALFMVCLATVGVMYKEAMWVFLCLTALVGFPVKFSLFSWIEKYIILYAVVVGILEVARGLSGFLFQWLAGVLYDVYRPEAVYTLAALAACAVALVMLFLQIVASWHGPRVKKEPKTKPLGKVASKSEFTKF